MKKIIELFIFDGIWHAKFHNHTEVMDLFGTDTLPTAFMACLPAQTVLEQVQKRNPQCNVVLR